jgi:hypothetical protein
MTVEKRSFSTKFGDTESGVKILNFFEKTRLATLLIADNKFYFQTVFWSF